MASVTDCIIETETLWSALSLAERAGDDLRDPNIAPSELARLVAGSIGNIESFEEQSGAEELEDDTIVINLTFALVALRAALVVEEDLASQVGPALHEAIDGLRVAVAIIMVKCLES